MNDNIDNYKNILVVLFRTDRTPQQVMNTTLCPVSVFKLKYETLCHYMDGGGLRLVRLTYVDNDTANCEILKDEGINNTLSATIYGIK